MVFYIVNLPFRICLNFHIPKIILSDFWIHPKEHLMCQLLLKLWSNLNQGFKSPSNRPGEVITSSNRIDSKNKEIWIDSSTDELIYYPENGSISTWYDNSEMRLWTINKLLDKLELLEFLLLLEQVSKVNECSSVWLKFELYLGKVVSKVLTTFSITTFCVDKKEKVIIGRFLGI